MVILGNESRLMIDGSDTYAARLRAIAGARDHINLDTFIFRDDELGRKLADALMQKQSEGVGQGEYPLCAPSRPSQDPRHPRE